MEYSKILDASLDRIEDSIFISKEEAKKAIDNFSLLLRFFTQKNKTNVYNLSLKLDGFPSFIFSYTKENGFYIATKSVLQSKPIYNKSIEDIYKNYPQTQQKLIGILELLFHYLSVLRFEGTFKADFLYEKHSIVITKNLRNAYGNLYIVFNPNSLVYAIPYDSDLGEDILESVLGISVYAMYSSPDIETAQLIVSKEKDFYKKFIKNEPKHIKIFYPDVIDISNLKYTTDEKNSLEKLIKEIDLTLSKIDSSFYRIVLANEFYEKLLKEYIYVTNADDISSDSLFNFINYKIKEEIQNIFSKDKEKDIQDKFYRTFRELKNYLPSISVIKTWYHIALTIKKALLYKIKQLEDIKKYISYSIELEENHGKDGVVCIDIDGDIVKLVNKKEFVTMDIDYILDKFLGEV